MSDAVSYVDNPMSSDVEVVELHNNAVACVSCSLRGRVGDVVVAKDSVRRHLIKHADRGERVPVSILARVESELLGDYSWRVSRETTSASPIQPVLGAEVAGGGCLKAGDGRGGGACGRGGCGARCRGDAGGVKSDSKGP